MRLVIVAYTEAEKARVETLMLGVHTIYKAFAPNSRGEYEMSVLIPHALADPILQKIKMMK
jgi:hypothetical protein